MQNNTTAAQVGKKLNNATSKAAKTAKAKGLKNFASKAEKAGTVITIILILLPALIALVQFIRKEMKAKEKPSLKDGWGQKVTKVSHGNLSAEGEDLIECAMEGLRARAQKKQEQADSEFDRRVAVAVKKAMQGHQRM